MGKTRNQTKKKLDSSRIVCYTLDANEKSKAELKRVTNYDLKCMHDKNENKRTVVQQQQQQSRKEQNKWQNIKSRPTTTKHWITYSITLYCLTSDPIPIQTYVNSTLCSRCLCLCRYIVQLCALRTTGINQYFFKRFKLQCTRSRELIGWVLFSYVNRFIKITFFVHCFLLSSRKWS